MSVSRILTLSLLAVGVVAQTSIDDPRTTQTDVSVSTTENATPTGSYNTHTSQETLGSSLGISSSMAAGNATTTSDERSTQTTSTKTTVLQGKGSKTTIGNSTASETGPSTPEQTNTTPCNNYPEFCQRKYGNITEVSCHNSPFVVPNNLAANQQYDVTYQLDDGVRFLQAQIQWPTGANEPHFCHTSCDILDAGVITNWLSQVTNWVARHPYDVVTILLGNGNYSTPDKYVPYIQDSGILNYVYTPPVAPMHLDDWPTLEDMIIQGKRVVMFMDYMANQKRYPWLLDEFSQMWETPFDPVDQDFPCTVQRPPQLPQKEAENRLFLINHNLNLELDLLGINMLVPAREELNRTNNNTGFGSLGQSANNCVKKWDRPPTFLNVDYYNNGSFPGSVFEVAAKMNNVTYNRPCCGPEASDASTLLHVAGSSSRGVIYGAMLLSTFWVLS